LTQLALVNINDTSKCILPSCKQATNSLHTVHAVAWCSLPTSMGSLTRTTIMIHTHKFIAHFLAEIYHTHAGRATGPDTRASPRHKSELTTLLCWRLTFITLGDWTLLRVSSATVQKKRRSTDIAVFKICLDSSGDVA